MNSFVFPLQTLSVIDVESVCGSDHLTSFATGFVPEVNTIDFDFVFAHASFEDNLTIYFCLIICFTIYIIGMIWAIVMDFSDKKKVIELNGKMTSF